jgi:pimeloyl-ACP methyl ester carboxylesterase
LIERPLILVPGILESSLAIGKDPEFFGIWPLTPLSVPSYDFLDNLLSDLGTNIRKSINDKVSVVTTGLLPGAYDNIISAIIGWGYTLGSNFWTFPYDWRQSNEISGQMLAEFIKNKNLDSLDIICHSMGGFVTRAAYNHGARAHIKRTAYIASPHFGNPISYFELNPEIHNVGFYDFYEKAAMTDELRRIISGATKSTKFEKKMNDLYRKWPSAYELMPDDFYLNTRPMIYSDGQPILGTNETYMKNGWRLPQNEQGKVRKAMEFKKSLGEKLPGNEDDILVIYSNTLETLDTIGYSSTGITIHANYPPFHFSPPIDYNQCGDTVVVTDSAMGSMSGSPTYKNSKSIPNVTHTGLPNNNETIGKIKKFLKV